MKYFLSICAIFASLYFLPVVSSQTKTENEAQIEEKAVTITAKGRGFPHINFDDGAELTVGANRSSTAAKLLTSADFDSDGTADLLVADASGNLKSYRGNIDSIFPNSPEAVNRKSLGTFNTDAFYAAESSFALPLAPDYLEAGDFNADGLQDVLAARKGDGAIYLLPGDGTGNFADAVQIPFDGAITALKVGEIGQLDGLTDVAVAVLGKNGAHLLVFEHPNGAFKHPPEIIKLKTTVTDLAIGNLDTDYFLDIAVAEGNFLTVVRGRGQVYPYDSVEGFEIERPAPISETRAMPFQIAALVTGFFTEKRGESLAMLTTSGSIEILDSPTLDKKGIVNPENLKKTETGLPVNATEKRLSNYKSFTETFVPNENLQKEQETEQTKEQKLTADLQAALLSGNANLEPEANQRAIENFLKAVSPKENAPLSRWNLQTIVSPDARLADAANSVLTSKLVKVRVSDSGRDELAFIDNGANQIHLMIRENPKRNRAATAKEIVSLETKGAPVAILPMRLNVDALSDLVVLRADSAVPSIVMTAPTATFTVTTAADEDDGACDASCSLREAIDAANNSSGTNLINFNIGGGGMAVIRPGSGLGALPNIENSVTINATTQPGFAGQPLIEIKGDLTGVGANGLSVNAANVVVRGFVINQFDSIVTSENGQIGGAGIAVFNFEGDTFTQFCIIEGNYLGTDSTGTQDRGNDQAGLLIFDADNNTVGGSTTAARNLLSGNGDGEIFNGPKVGLGLSVIDGRTNLIFGNYIGTSANGLSGIGNSTGLGIGGMNNQIGSDQPNTGNLVSGNTHRRFSNFDPQGCFGDGISDYSLISISTGEWVSANNLYKANRVGLTAAGNAPLSNCRVGLYTSPRNSATIGSITENGRNTISGNTDGGLYCTTAPRGGGDLLVAKNLGPTIPEGYCRVIGNNVGTDVTGNFSIPNDHRRGDQLVRYNGALVVINTETLSTIGGTSGTSANSCTGNCNLVSGNGFSGVYDNVPGIVSYGLGTVSIYRNFVGTNKSGTTAVSNYVGIQVGVLSGIPGGGNTNIGGLQTGTTTSSLGNLISGNRREAISIFDQSPDVLAIAQVRGNLIGTNAAGLSAIPNCSTGDGCYAVFLSGTEVVIVGGADPLEGNIISGNNGTGILFFGEVLTTATRNNYIGVNRIGQPLGNSRDGIELRGTFDYIGDNGAGNIIANNGRNGIFAADQSGNYGNRIKYNSIYNNGALGIDLSADTTPPRDPDGVTPNDCLDSDTGSNALQNYPILAAPVFNGNGTVSIEGGLQSVPNQTFTLDFYASSTIDPTSYGEGQTYVGSISVTTDGIGLTTFLFASETPVAPTLKITATATDFNGSTSEFSCAAGECAGRSGKLTEDELRQLGETSCTPELIVNTTTDEPDFTPNNEFCDVDLDTVGPQCSLRAAIATAQGSAYPGLTVIKFNIPGEGNRVITLTREEPLPAIVERVYIDATTQPGWVDKPIVEVRGSDIYAQGLNFAPGSDNSGVWGMAFNRFPTAIRAQTNTNTINGNYIGLSADGTAAGTVEQNGVGIDVSGTQNKLQFNVVSNNSLGIVINGNGNTVSNNKIGTSVPGGGSIPNIVGVSLGGNSSSNIIEDNQISGNINTGISLEGSATSNIISENKIGTSADGTAEVGNKFGVSIADNASTNDILNNQISGNTDFGVYLTGNSANNLIQDNKIGTNADGTTRVKNGIGIYTKSNGVNNQFTQNLISGNTLIGVYLTETANRNLLFRNKIGTNLAGTDAISNPVGIQIEGQTGDIQVEENTISGNTIAGIVIKGDSINNQLLKNQIGTNSDGSAGLGNLRGVIISDKANASKIISNTISGNTESGITLEDRSTNTLVRNNKIGTNKLGNAEIPNKDGIKIVRVDTSSDTSNQFIVENLISGNTLNGILVSGTNVITEIAANKIGTDETGNEAIANEFGIRLEGLTTLTEIYNNTISGNKEAGIYLKDNTRGNTIRQNKIGTNEAGNAEVTQLLLPKFGICISGSSDDNTVSDNVVAGLRVGILIGNSIGTPYTPEEPLTISKDNASVNLGIGDNFIFGNKVFDNTVGLNAAKSAPIPTDYGIALGENARQNTIGSGVLGQHNLIAGTRRAGIFIGTQDLQEPVENLPQLNRVSGNVLGISGDGTKRAISNNLGMILYRSYNNIIAGRFDPINGIMSANIFLASIDVPILVNKNSNGNTIQGNIFGKLPDFFEPLHFGKTNLLQSAPVLLVEDYGNGGGILIQDGSSNNIIGGDTSDQANIVTENAGSGISIALNAGNGNKIGVNSFYGNDGIGIDLGNDGHTPNDPNDMDIGPNNLQNYPVIISRQVVNDELIIGFKIDSAPEHSAYGANGIYVEFFKADMSGEGERFLASAFYTLTDYNSLAPGVKTVNLGNLSTLGINANDPITATATDANGNTSEFMPFAPTAASAAISGRVTANGVGVSRARVILTDSKGQKRTALTNLFGNYRFEEVNVGETYIFNVTAKQHTFNPRILTVVEAIANFNFEAQ